MRNMSISKKDTIFFLNNYNLGKITKIQPIKRGLMNKIFYVKTEKGHFALKVAFQNNEKIKLQYEIDLLNFLKNLPIPKPIRQKNNEYISLLGKNQSFLMTFLSGKHREIITNENLKGIGFFLGEMHQQTKNFSSLTKRAMTLDHSLNSLHKIYRYCTKIKDKEIKVALEYIKSNINFYLPPKEGLVYGAIHSDLKPENCLFKNSKLSGVVDFDNSYNAPLIIDLANTIMWFCADKRGLNIGRSKLLVAAYSKKRKLNKIESKYLPLAVHFVYLRNVLRAIEYYAKGRVSKSWVLWALKDILSLEKKLPNLLNF
jgi:homoserine kinase type II